MRSLNTKAFGGLFFLLLVMAALLFLPARTLDYWQAWAFLAIFGASALAITVYLMKNDPKLLERRVYAGPTAEKETSQRIIQFVTSIWFIAILVVSALDYRFAWSVVPLYIVVAGDALVATGFLFVFLCTKKIPLPRQLSKSLSTRKSYRRDSTHSCAIRCIWGPFSYLLAYPSRSALTVDCS